MNKICQLLTDVKDSMYMVDSILSPKNEPAVSTILETDVLMTFSQITGTFGYVKIGDFQVDTDVSVMPYELI